ncbi:hypothetical protein [Sphingomonas zeae]
MEQGNAWIVSGAAVTAMSARLALAAAACFLFFAILPWIVLGWLAHW